LFPVLIVGNVNNYDFVPIYDVILNKDMSELRVLYDFDESVVISCIDLSESMNSMPAVNHLYDGGSQVYNLVVKNVGFVTPDTVKIENKLNSSFQYRFQRNSNDTDLIDSGLIWWNGVGNISSRVNKMDKFSGYYSGNSEPNHVQTEWRNWYRTEQHVVGITLDITNKSINKN